MAVAFAAWRPSPGAAKRTQLAALMQKVGGIVGRSFRDYVDFHAFTVERREEFWSVLWDESGIVGPQGRADPGRRRHAGRLRGLNREALANPEALDLFRNLDALRT